jgi:hypothetical protein
MRVPGIAGCRGRGGIAESTPKTRTQLQRRRKTTEQRESANSNTRRQEHRNGAALKIRRYTLEYVPSTDVQDSNT